MDAPTKPELAVEWLDGDVVVATIDRRHAANTISFALWAEFGRLLDEIEGGTPPRALIVCGAGGHLGNGGDVKTPPARGDGALALAARLEIGQRILRRLRDLPVPTIAAVDVGAWGISWSLALACDVVIAGQGARFGAPFLDFGLVPDGGAAWFLTRAVGRYRAAELILSGRTIDAAEAHALGLVSRVVAADGARDAAIGFAQGLANGNRRATELAKRLLACADGTDLAGSHALELVYCHVCQSGDEARTAREAFQARAAAARAAKGRD